MSVSEALLDNEYPATCEQVGAACADLLRLCALAGVEVSVIHRARLALDELAANVVAHGPVRPGRTFQLRALIVAEDLVVSISSAGPGVDPRLVASPDLDAPLEERAEGGLGLVLLRAMVDRVEHHAAGDQSKTTFAIRLRS